MSKTLLGILVAATILVIALYFGGVFQGVQTLVANAPTGPKAQPSVAVSDNPNVVVDDLVQSASMDAVTPDVSDPSLVQADSQTVDALDQSSNPNQF